MRRHPELHHQESLFSISEWLKLYYSRVSLQAKTASACAMIHPFIVRQPRCW